MGRDESLKAILERVLSAMDAITVLLTAGETANS
jgi:hypothetical protein